MAQQRKKSRTGRKPGSRKSRRGNKEGISIRSVLKAVTLLLAAFIVGFIGYFIGYDAGKEEYLAAANEERRHTPDPASALKQTKKVTASHEYETAPPKPSVRPEVSRETQRAKPKLAIIIDDVSFARDVRNVKALELPLNLSFLPPSKRHPESAELAEKEPFYMVHLPMEAMSFSAEEPDTLHVGDSEEKIEERIRQIKGLFPRVLFVNNHTGSKFTADHDAMEKLIYALDREGITFIDSRTTAKTAVPALMKSLHRPYISRDVFLDHDPDVDAVKKQVQRAVAIAKKYGSAIAIGHPHIKTLQGLAESKAVLEEVELVRIDTLAATAQ